MTRFDAPAGAAALAGGAIETRYAGCHFRSRLEARWAVFFDALGITWQYEPEGFELPSGRYLPDFLLVDMDTWIEVKAIEPTSDECQKLSELVDATGKQGLIVSGEPFTNVLLAKHQSDAANSGAWWIRWPRLGAGEEESDGSDGPYLFCECPWCHKIGLEFDGRGALVCGYRKHHESEDVALAAIRHLGHWRADDKCYTGDSNLLTRAALAARSARFEFGQEGAAV